MSFFIDINENTRQAWLKQTLAALPAGNWAWPLAYAYALLGVLYFKLRANKRADDLACFGWQCVAVKVSPPTH